MTDFPDWQPAPASQSASAFTAFTQDLAPGTHAGAITPVHSYQSLNLVITATAGAAKVTVTHWADAAGVNQVGADTWPLNTAAPLTVRVPLRGPCAQVTIDVTSSGNLSASTWGTYQTAAAARISYPVRSQALFQPQTTLAASATTAYTMPAVCAGLATWSYVPYDTAGMISAYLQTVDELGNFLAIFTDRGSPTVIDNALIVVPDGLIQVVVSNNDAAASHDFAFALTVPPQ